METNFRTIETFTMNETEYKIMRMDSDSHYLDEGTFAIVDNNHDLISLTKIYWDETTNDIPTKIMIFEDPITEEECNEFMIKNIETLKNITKTFGWSRAKMGMNDECSVGAFDEEELEDIKYFFEGYKEDLERAANFFEAINFIREAVEDTIEYRHWGDSDEDSEIKFRDDADTMEEVLFAVYRISKNWDLGNK